jgi:uncharacterized membrane protein YsdA (DUF1294 family)
MREVAYKPYLFYGTVTAGIACVTASLLFLQVETSLLVSAIIGINVAALVAMGLDKSLSRSHSPRIPEIVLYVVALLGGSPGILAGSHIFRHKIRKAVFQLTLLVVFTLQVALVRLLEIQVR